MTSFHILGPLRVVVDGEPVPIVRRQERGILTMLSTQPRRVVHVDRLIELIWADRPPEHPLQAVWTCLSRLRTTLVKSGSARDVIERSANGYRLNVDPRDVDAHRFELLVLDAQRSEDPAARSRLLRTALDLWRGPALADIDNDTMRNGLAVRLDERRRAAVYMRLEADLGLGAHAAIVGELVELTREAPLDETLARFLMTALSRSGRRDEALDAYRRLATGLREELGLDPGEAVTALQAAVLRGEEPRGAAAGPSGAAEEPARIAPAQLPLVPAGFAGRDQPLRRLDALMETWSERYPATLITAIAGCPGVGKTTLAVYWAHRIRHRFPDGQLYLDLNGHASTAPMRATEALAHLLRGLGVPDDRIPVDPAQAAAAYRTALAGTRTLVVLDNVRDAEQVRPLLPGGTTCMVLVTSRERLTGLVAREGATLLTLDVLSPPESQDLLASVLGERRVSAEPEAAAELARLCGHLPLALRVVAARLVDSPLRLGDQVAALSRGDRIDALRIADDPQAGVDAAFDLSYQGLSSPARRLFRLLGLLPSMEFSAGATAALLATSPSRADELLDRLGAAHLLNQPTPGRYAFHDLLRHYAARLAHRTDRRAARSDATDRVFRYYLDHADRAVELLHPDTVRAPRDGYRTPRSRPGSATASEAGTWLETERDNLLSVIAHTSTYGPPTVCWQLVESLTGYFWRTGHTIDWIRAADAGLAAANLDGTPTARAAMHLNLGLAQERLRHNRGAADHYRSAVGLSRQAEWPDGLATALTRLGNIHLLIGELGEATECHLQALELHRRTGHRAAQAAVLINLGTVSAHGGRLAEALERHTAALALLEPDGSPSARANALANIGHTELALGRPAIAQTHLEAALRINRETENRLAEAITLHDLAEVQRENGDLIRARTTGGAALDLARETKGRLITSYILNLLGTVDLRLGRLDAAHDHHDHALRIAHEIDAAYPYTDALIGLAMVAGQAGQHAPARTYLHRAQDSADRFGYTALARRARSCREDLAMTR
jgi:DNA-binding SARP family transcriptional activator/Tfp pilus assembly protein PilF